MRKRCGANGLRWGVQRLQTMWQTPPLSLIESDYMTGEILTLDGGLGLS